MGGELDQSAIERYRRTGALSPFRVFDEAEAARLRGALEAVEAERGPVFTENRPRPGDMIRGSYRFKSHLLFRWLAEVVRTPRILDLVEDLIGPDILCWTTHWFIKEAHSPQYVSWHQDSRYWGVESDRFVSVWLALSPATRASGCLRVLPGSHLKPPMEHEDTWSEHNMLTRGQSINGIDEARALELELAPGEVALFDYRLAHASAPNTSDDRRIGIGIRYIAPSARQVQADWDSASLVRGSDRFGHFEPEPEPSCDFDPVAVAFHERADAEQRKIYYQGATTAGDRDHAAAG
ncbi:MAG: phytanoyl-CoA dioxygenase family protein [Alphaproteobacteria bacterium]|nr:phytanoyl-CoA dioxygenase family protein [Alphaproteobacteria bacterium]